MAREMPVELGEILAERTYFLEPGQKVIVRLGRPFSPAEHPYESWCPWQVEGLGSGKVWRAIGEDDFQSIWLAMTMIGATLYTSEAYEAGRLRFDESSSRPDLGLPVPESLRDLLPPWPPPRPDSPDA